MADIVLDTHAFAVLCDAEFAEKVMAKGDHVFVEECAWKKEMKGVYGHLINILYSSVKRLNSHFHVKTTRKTTLPIRVKEEMEKCHASDCDILIANLAHDRHKRNKQQVCLVSSDHCFQNSERLLNHCGILVRALELFIVHY